MQTTFRSFVTLGALTSLAESIDIASGQNAATEAGALPDLKANRD